MATQFDIRGLKKGFPADGCVILDECQHTLGILESAYRSRKSDRRGILPNGKFEYPRSLFTFLIGVLSDSIFRLMMAGTQMRIGCIELNYSAAGEKPSTVDIFTEFNFITAAQIAILLPEWLNIDSIGILNCCRRLRTTFRAALVS